MDYKSKYELYKSAYLRQIKIIRKLEKEIQSLEERLNNERN